MSIKRLTADSASATNEIEKNDNRLVIKVDTPESFPVTKTIGIFPLQDLMEKVSELFSAVYADYAGCYIVPLPNNVGFDVRLYFKSLKSSREYEREQEQEDGPENNYAFTVRDLNVSDSGIMDTIKVIGSRSQKKVYELTDDGKSGIGDFVLNQFKNNKGIPRWDQIVNEQVQQGMNPVTYAVVTGIDIYKLLQTIYGKKDTDGGFFQYNLTTIRPTGQSAPTAGAMVNWLVQLEKVKTTDIAELGRKVGIISFQGIPMV